MKVEEQSATANPAPQSPEGVAAGEVVPGLRRRPWELSDIGGACHLVVNYRGVYDFLADRGGIAMEDYAPQPRILRKGRLAPLNFPPPTVAPLPCDLSPHDQLKQLEGTPFAREAIARPVGEELLPAIDEFR